MPAFNPRLRTLETLSRSQIHQSLATPASHVAMARCRTSCLNDPEQAMDILRSLVQPAINEEIRRVMQGFIDKFFTPAVANAVDNVGAERVGSRLIEDTCVAVLENAKAMYTVPVQAADPPVGVAASANMTKEQRFKGLKRSRSVVSDSEKVLAASGSSSSSAGAKKKKGDAKPNQIGAVAPRPNTDLILVSKTGKPVRREGPKWEEGRFNYDTLFILGSKANKALGFGQTRGRLYIKYPALFK